MHNNLINKDYAYLDARSITAMLHGHGDGREKAFCKFAISHAALDEQALIAAYNAYAAKQPLRQTKLNRGFFWAIWYCFLIEPLAIWICLKIPAVRNFLTL